MAKKKNGKRQLSKDQEFQIFKLVLDKFLWIGFVIMLYGVWQTAIAQNLETGILWMIGGIVLLLILVSMIVKGYEVGKH